MRKKNERKNRTHSPVLPFSKYQHHSIPLLLLLSPHPKQLMGMGNGSCGLSLTASLFPPFLLTLFSYFRADPTRGLQSFMLCSLLYIIISNFRALCFLVNSICPISSF